VKRLILYINTIYLGVCEAICNGFSISSFGAAGFSPGFVGRGFRLKASSIFSICRSCPPSPLSAINLEYNYYIDVRNI
jgi:hypothetical protein